MTPELLAAMLTLAARDLYQRGPGWDAAADKVAALARKARR